jgi:adenylosuccinate lyase
MRRLFWLAMGITIGALVVRRLSRLAEQVTQRLTPKGVTESVGTALADLAHQLGDLAGEVRSSMRARERELREGSGLDATVNGVSK